MSHFKERKEKNCLNCNAEVNGRFCGVCGQENVEPAESAGHLVMHFFNDITHFDGKFFSSLKYLIFKPGFLSTQYRIGRRASYLNPVRMYVFTSFIFFFTFFSVFHFDDMVDSSPTFNKKTLQQISAMDSTAFQAFAKDVDSTRKWDKESVLKFIDSLSHSKKMLSEYKSKAEYDSLLKLKAVKDGWFSKKVNYRKIELDEKYHGDQQKMVRDLIGTFAHSLPQMLFVSLPLFALFLKLLYWRRKQFYYVSHAIFSLHLYIFIFIVFLVVMGLSALGDKTGWAFFDYLVVALNISIFFYIYKAMRNFYSQRRAKTVVKFLLLMIYLLIILALIFTFFIVFSLLKI